MTDVATKNRPQSSAVRVKNDVYESVKEYSDETGVAIARVIEDALQDWLKTVGAARLEVLRSQKNRLAELIPFPQAGAESVPVVGVVS